MRFGKADALRASFYRSNRSNEDIHTEPQRTATGMVIAGLCTGGIYAGLNAIARRNERKYLQQLESEFGDWSDRH